MTNLAQIRADMGLTQYAFAEAMGCSTQVYGSYEREDRDPPEETSVRAQRLLRFLGGQGRRYSYEQVFGDVPLESDDRAAADEFDFEHQEEAFDFAETLLRRSVRAVDAQFGPGASQSRQELVMQVMGAVIENMRVAGEREAADAQEEAAATLAEAIDGLAASIGENLVASIDHLAEEDFGYSLGDSISQLAEAVSGADLTSSLANSLDNVSGLLEQLLQRMGPAPPRLPPSAA